MRAHKPGEQVTDWRTALEYLKDGNRRYVRNECLSRDTNAGDRSALAEGQKPFAIVVTCSDSRVSPEIYFDQGHGDIFVIRNAGNIADTAALGSVEYAAGHLHVPLIAVVGHSRCGAVTGALSGDGDFPENLRAVIGAIAAAAEGSANLEDAVCANAKGVAEKLGSNAVVRETGVRVVSAYYDIETGVVEFFED